MNKQHSSEMQSVRKKLLAATAMLLVAVIMTVSSTYAWFTLSTAPEVKGITTTVGANGNLEIALGTYDTVYGTSKPLSYEGSSMDATNDVTVSNITWGNLVDLSHSSYGLDKIVLYPTRLNANGTALNAFNPLQFALYGSDGRITELSGNTTLGKYNTTSAGYETLDTINFAGVNAIGSVSSMSPRAFAERNYRNAIDGYRISAQNEAKGAMSLYAGELAGIALENQNSTEETVIADETLGYDKITTLENLISKLEKANDNIGLSLKSAALLSITCVDDLGDEGWEIAIDAASADDYTIHDIIKNITTIAGSDDANLELPPELTEVVDKHDAIYTLINEARLELEKAGEDNIYTWGEIEAPVAALLNKSGILICDFTIEEIMDDYAEGGTAGGPVEQVSNKVFDTGLEFTFDETSGIFADIAEMTGEYNTKIQFPKDLKVESIPLGTKPWPVTVASSCTTNTAKGELGNAYEFLAEIHAPTTTDPNVAKALTDTYGYTVDMLFRTNAVDSQLQLQTEAANRIYDENDSSSLMGGGSNMTFTVTGEYADTTKINGLASGIRVVFYESTTSTAQILAVATLDTANGTVSGEQYKLNLKLQNFTIDAEGEITITGEKEDASICDLTSNVEKKITALVYLDGDVIDNSNVGLIDELDGKLNLQFSSSASLTPMVNNTLLNS